MTKKKMCENCEKEWVNEEQDGDLWLEVDFNPEEAYMTIRAKRTDLYGYNDLAIKNYHICYCPWCGRKLD